jgi:hypothetical protein
MQVLEDSGLDVTQEALRKLLHSVDALLTATGAELLSRERDVELQFVNTSCEVNRQLLCQPGISCAAALAAAVVCLVGEHFSCLVRFSMSSWCAVW